MTASEVLNMARQMGVTLTARPDGTISAAPTPAVTAELVEAIRAVKAQVIEALSAEPYPAPGWLKLLVDDLLAAGAELVMQDGRAVTMPEVQLPPRAVATIETRQAELIETLRIVAESSAEDTSEGHTHPVSDEVKR